VDQKFHSHVKAFLLSHQIGEDPEKNLAKIKVIANSNPARWDGRLPTQGIRLDTSFCKVVETTRGRPVVPWWWYAEENEPVPAVVRDIYERLTFDFALLYPKRNAWIYICVEPPPETLALLGRQEHLKAFILMSLINKNFPRAQRERRRVRLGTLMDSKDIQRIFHFRRLQGGGSGLQISSRRPSGPEPARASLLQHRQLEHQAAAGQARLRQLPGDSPRIVTREAPLTG
jgi:hypothetical protein